MSLTATERAMQGMLVILNQNVQYYEALQEIAANTEDHIALAIARRALGAPEDAPPGWGCDCRNPSCGHKAYKHVGERGACIEPGCTCGPGGWV